MTSKETENQKNKEKSQPATLLPLNTKIQTYEKNIFFPFNDFIYYSIECSTLE